MTLQQVNIWIEKAALFLVLPKVEITEDDIPMEALSDLESDPEDVDDQMRVKYAKEAGLENATSKWMSRRKSWTSDEVSHCSIDRCRCKYSRIMAQFETLKSLAKCVINSQEAKVQGSAISKKGLITSQYRGPLTSRRPVLMKNIQDWMVDLIILPDNIATCKRNRDPPFTPETVLTLRLLLDTALEICLKGGDDNLDGTEPAMG